MLLFDYHAYITVQSHIFLRVIFISGLQYELRDTTDSNSNSNNRFWSVQPIPYVPGEPAPAWQVPASAGATYVTAAAAAMSGVGAGVSSPGQVAARTPAAPKRPVRRGGKAPPDRPQRVLFCLHLKNPIRKLCIDVVEWKYPFNNKY